MKLEELESKNILIVGRGVEGEAVSRFLKKHVPSSKVTIVDQKDGEDYLDKQKDYDIAVKSPGIKPSLLTIPYTTATNIFFANAKGKIIGVTGTKGKSTTSTLIYEMLQKKYKNTYFGGNIGQSPLDFLDTLTDQSWTVLELSSFQLQDVKMSPHIAVLLMVAMEHLDYHNDVYEYIEAKRNILRFQTPSDIAILNRDYPASHESDVLTAGKVFQISRERECEQGCYVGDEAIWVKKDGKKEKIINTKDLLLLGAHNLENVCAAVMATTLVGVSKQNIASVLKSFKGLEHRLEFVGEYQGIRFYNDSLATIPQATIEALEALPETETLIAGGYDRGVDYEELGESIVKSNVKTLILFPPTGVKIWERVLKKIKNQKSKIKKFDANSMEEAVKIANRETMAGKICLLSPASASFGIFKNYKDRGEQFKREVRKLGNTA